MRVLHVVKTSDGADWAAAQAAELVKLGVEVHVALPRDEGRTVQQWSDYGAVIHIGPTDLPIRSPWLLPATLRRLRDLVSRVCPDLIHSHFFGSTVLLRLALGASHRTPRLFQVPGPLHMEHRFWRMLELSTAGSCDSWIASSRCILAHYRAAGVSEERLYLSYYGIPAGACPGVRTGFLRKRYGIADHIKIVGNANFMYPPKWYLGQRVGLKAHEDVIDALGLVLKQRADVMGVLIGGSSIASDGYERRLRQRAQAEGGDRILMTGYLPVEEIRQMWPDFDVAVHIPISENCGGVGEPMLAGVSTIAGSVGGLPEAVIDGVTGSLVPVRRPQELARAILRVLDSPDHYSALARNGQALMRRMVSTERIGQEILAIYASALGNRVAPLHHFDPAEALDPAFGCIGCATSSSNGQ
jgi:glycosyltransferase involved in cell wall biosynthesis